MGGLAEGRHQAAAVAGARRQHDVARLDALRGDRGEVGAEAVGAEVGRDDGHGLPAGDEFELVLDGLHEGTVGCPASVGSGVDAPKVFQSGSGSRGRGPEPEPPRHAGLGCVKDLGQVLGSITLRSPRLGSR
ncbi:MAG: hypothetical protein JWR70_2945 [Modestobacter sp.]|nr:hypothetical protein [Modestobacter sp.]